MGPHVFISWSSISLWLVSTVQYNSTIMVTGLNWSANFHFLPRLSYLAFAETVGHPFLPAETVVHDKWLADSYISYLAFAETVGHPFLPAETVVHDKWLADSPQEAIFLQTVVLAGSKGLWYVSTEAKYKSQQEVKTGGLVYTL